MHQEEKLVDILNNWLIKYKFTARVEGVSNWGWGWCKETDEIALCFCEDPDIDAMWESFIYNYIGCKIKCHTFFSSFLHELGHSETWEFIPEEEIDVFGRYKSPFEYFTLPREIAATRWAINFMETQSIALAELIEITTPIIIELDEMASIHKLTNDLTIYSFTN